MSVKTVRIVLMSVAAIVLLWSFAAPLLCAAGSVRGLDGTVGIVDNGALWGRVDPFSSVIYTIGDLLCHQMDSRSLIVNGNQMPFCVRDVSMLAGFVVGMALVSFAGLVRSKRTDVFVVSSFVLIIADWAFQHFTGNNMFAARIVTGLLAGAAIALMIGFALEYLTEESVLRRNGHP